MITINARPLALVLALLFVALGMSACPERDTLMDCSRRGKPQHYDGEKWTCRD